MSFSSVYQMMGGVGGWIDPSLPPSLILSSCRSDRRRGRGERLLLARVQPLRERQPGSVTWKKVGQVPKSFFKKKHTNKLKRLTCSFFFPSCNSFHCGSCQSVVDTPETRIQLEVFLSSSLAGCTLKVKVRTATFERSVFRQDRPYKRPQVSRSPAGVCSFSVISQSQSAELIGVNQPSYHPG